MALKFLSFLGTGEYKEAVYELDGIYAEKTAYIQRAILEVFAKSNQPIDEVCIFLTGQAKIRNWENVNSSRPLLKESLSSLDEQYPLKISHIEVPSTNQVDDIWGLFQIVLDTIDEGDEIIFDITHSFRYQPMLALLILHYARAAKDIQVKGIYYASFDVNQQSEVTSIVDLTPLSDLQDWITNVYAFLKSGNASILTQWIDEKDKSIRREERRTTLDLKVLRKLTESWEALTTSLQTNRGPLINQKAQEALKHLHNIQEVEVRPIFRPLNTLYKKIETQFSDIAHDDPVQSGLSAIEWCEEHGLIQQSYTMAKELVTTVICQKYQRNPRDANLRHLVDQAVSHALKINDGQSSIEQITNPQVKQFVEAILPYPQLLSAVKIIQDFRNDINHAGWRPDPLSEDKFYQQYQYWYPVFKESLTRFWEEPFVC